MGCRVHVSIDGAGYLSIVAARYLESFADSSCFWYAVVQYWSAGIWAFCILWGFVLCVEALFGICLDVCRASSPRGSRDDNEDTTGALTTRYCPYM